MKGATRITRTTQKTEEKPTIVSRRTRIETSSQNRPSGQTSTYTTTQKTTTTINKQKDSFHNFAKRLINGLYNLYLFLHFCVYNQRIYLVLLNIL